MADRLILEDAIAFIESLTAVPLLMGDDIEMRLQDVQKHARVEAASLRKRMIAAPNPSPAAKGGDAVREALEDARDNGLIYWEPNTERGHTNKALMLARIDAALSTPTEGPAPQAEGVGGDALREIANDLERSAGKPLVEGSWGGLALEPVARAIAQDRGALTPPETAEAVPAGPFVVMSANYSRPFMLGCYDTLNQAVMAQCGSPEKWHVFSRHPVSDPEAARLREDLERVTQELEEETALRVGAIDRMKKAESKRDDAVKALHKLRSMPGFRASAYRIIDAALSSDPAPATDDREKLVEAARLNGIQDGLEMARHAYEAHDRTNRDWVKDSLWDKLNREAAARVAALITEKSR